MIGNRAWIDKRAGDLSELERFRLLLRIVRLRIKARLRPPAAIAEAAGQLIAHLPASKLVRLAKEECLDRCSPSIFHHSCRTFYWAAAIAEIDGVPFDAEELAVASLLHDIELGKVQERAAAGCHCFAGAGAVTADAWLKSNDAGADMRAAITEAIALHLNPGVRLSLGATPHLLNVGAMADVVGSRMAAISAEQRGHTLAEHPRHGFKVEMKAHMRAEQIAAPKSRAGLLMNIGFAKLIDAAPFDA
jgi:hypothetical protein